MELQGTQRGVPAGSGTFPGPLQLPTTFPRTTPLTPAASCPRPTLDLESKEKHAFTSAGTNWSSVHVHGHPGDFPGAWVGHATND